MNIFQWIWDRMTISDEDRVASARKLLDKEIMQSPQALAWLKTSGWSASGDGRADAALRNPITRDAAIFAAIQNFKDSDDKPDEMLRRYTANGLNNGTTTHAYLLNMGEGTLGASQSNHHAVLLVDESVAPPQVTLAFRGTNPRNPANMWTHVTGFVDYMCGRPMKHYAADAEQFWQGAQGDITRIMHDLAARHPGAAPQITVAGHSYGADAAARMVPKLAEAFPASRGQFSMVGFGAMASISPAERASIRAVLGSDLNRGYQLFARNDWIKPLFTINDCVGEKRSLACNTGHEYKDATELEAMMDALQQQMARDPRHAEVRARAVVEAYKRDPDSVLKDLALNTSALVNGPGGTPGVERVPVVLS